MGQSDDGNGNGAAHAAHQAHIVLDFDMCTGALQIGGSVPSIDAAINMLQQALRHYEHEYRAAKAVEFAARAQRAAQDEQIRASLARGKG